MKRVLLTLALAFGPALLVVAAPALSLHPYQPAPVDFELAAPRGAVLGKPAAGGGVVSKPLEAPKRFNLVGLRWRGEGEAGAAVRTRRKGGEWSRWTTVPTHAEDAPDPGSGEPLPQGFSAPVWAGEADFVQYRVTERLRGLRLHFVNTNGTGTAGDRALNAVRRVANAGVMAVGGLASSPVGTADAAARKPRIVPRKNWRAGSCPPRDVPSSTKVKAAFVHHTVTTNSYTRAQSPQVVLGICRFHRNSNGWDDIGYNFLVDKYGVIFEGRAGGVDQPIMGAQAQGFNSQSTGIANLGSHSSRRQTGAALRSIAKLIRWKLPLHGARTAGTTTLVSAGGSANRFPAGRRVRVKRVSGHRDVGATACPGNALYNQLPTLRRLVGDLKPGKPMAIRAKIEPTTVRKGERALLSGRLRVRDGGYVAGAKIKIQRLSRTGWLTVREIRTRSDGRFFRRVLPQRTRRLRAYFPGTGTLRPIASRSTVLRVTGGS